MKDKAGVAFLTGDSNPVNTSSYAPFLSDPI